MVKFALGFIACAAGLFAIYQYAEATHRFGVVNSMNASLCTAVLNLLGFDATCSGTSVQLANGGMDIISECSAIYVAILFTAGVVAFPTSARARLLGLGLGLPIIFVINIVRLASLGAVIRYRPDLLPLFHEYLWQVFFILVVAGLYLLWIERFVPRARLDQPA